MGQRKEDVFLCRWVTHHGVHLYPGLLVRQVTKFEIKGIESSVNVGDKFVPCLSAVVEPYTERGIGDLEGGRSYGITRQGSGSNL